VLERRGGSGLVAGDHQVGPQPDHPLGGELAIVADPGQLRRGLGVEAREIDADDPLADAEGEQGLGHRPAERDDPHRRDDLGGRAPSQPPTATTASRTHSDHEASGMSSRAWAPGCAERTADILKMQIKIDYEKHHMTWQSMVVEIRT